MRFRTSTREERLIQQIPRFDKDMLGIALTLEGAKPSALVTLKDEKGLRKLESLGLGWNLFGIQSGPYTYKSRSDIAIARKGATLAEVAAADSLKEENARHLELGRLFGYPEDARVAFANSIGIFFPIGHVYEQTLVSAVAKGQTLPAYLPYVDHIPADFSTPGERFYISESSAARAEQYREIMRGRYPSVSTAIENNFYSALRIKALQRG